MGAAIGSKYLADPAKKMTSAETKKIRTHAVRKSGLRVAHQAITKAPIANETKNSGLESMKSPNAPAPTATGQRQRNANADSAGNTSQPVWAVNAAALLSLFVSCCRP